MQSSSIRRRSVIATIGAGTVGALAGCVGDLTDDETNADEDDGTSGWPAYRGGFHRSGRVPADQGPGETLNQDWIIDANEVLPELYDVEADPFNSVQTSWPVIVDGLACLSVVSTLNTQNGDAHHVDAVGVDLETGTIEWDHRLASSDE